MVTSLSLPPMNYFLINFITLSSFFLFLVNKASLKVEKKFFFFYGWLFGFGYFLTNLYWISISLTFDQNFKFLIPITLFLIPSFMALFYGLISFFFIIFKPKNNLSSFLIFSALFGFLEFVRGSILTGFPWNLISYSFSNQLEILSITSLIGTYGFNLFCISLFISPSMFILSKAKKDYAVCIFFLIVTIIFYSYGILYKKKFYNSEKKYFDYKIRIIGSNISLDRFYSNVDTGLIIEDLIKISNPDKNDKTIFVWPEGIFFEDNINELDKYRKLFSKNFNQNHILILGVNRQSIEGETEHYFNTFSLYDDKLNLLHSYNKINLVPFGEFLPFENILKGIGLRSLTNNYQSFSRGNERKIIEINKEKFTLKLLPLICYEIIYSGKLTEEYDFDLIINISEDGWFGKSVGPKQHLAHSIFRAIESGKYIVRSANNGIAAIINPLGSIEKKVNFGQSGYVDLEEINKTQLTLFSKYGNKIFGILILLYIFLIFSFNRNKK